MKRIIVLVLMLFVLSLCNVASARPYHHDRDGSHHGDGPPPTYLKDGGHSHSQGKFHRHDWSHPAYRHHYWRHQGHGPLPFHWYQHRSYFLPHHYRMEFIDDWEWQERFPGLRAYKWRDFGPGFCYRGERIKDVVLYYNDADELVSCGFMHNGLFVFIRDDDHGYESDDAFFSGWWSRW